MKNNCKRLLLILQDFKRSYWTPLEGFCILMNVYEFFEFFYSGQFIPVLSHIMSNASYDRERNNFQELSKLIELKFIYTTWPHWLTLTNKVTHQQIITCPKSFLITIKTLKLYIILIPCSSWNHCWMQTCTWSAFISLVLCLGKTSNSR